jgi:N4-gp56 family major capsid protein
MALTNFIPTIWSARLLANIHTALVFGQTGIVNRNYEGEISAYGDTVKINNIGAVSVFDYTRGVPMGEPEELTDAQRTLQITQSKAFHFFLDDIDKAQTNPAVMDSAMREAAYALAKQVDTFISTNLVANVAAGNIVGTDVAPIVPTAATAYETLVDLSVKLDESDTPEQGRFVVVPPWFHGLMLKDDRFVKGGTTRSDGVLANGQVGSAAGFNVLKSNTVPNTTGTKYKIVAGVQEAYTFAEQISKVEAYRPEKRFADAMKGLHLYGGKAIRPQFIAVATANKA